MSQVLLPKSWLAAPLSELAIFIDYRGKTPKKTTEGIPLITAKNIRDGFINREPQEFIDASDYDSWMTRGIPSFGDVVITTEAPLGNVATIDIKEKFALAQRAICLKFFDSDMGRFSYYALRSQNFQRKLSESATGSTVKGIKASILKTLKIDIPPLAEQKEIATLLDNLLAQVDTLKTRLDAIPNILKRFRQSVLAAAVSGKLTESDKKFKSVLVGAPWSHEIEGLDHWSEFKFSDLVTITGGSQPPKSEFKSEDGDNLIRLIQIRDYKSDNHKVFISKKEAKRLCSKRDIMIGRYGPPIFQILRGLDGAYNVALMKAEPKNSLLDQEYLY